MLSSEVFSGVMAATLIAVAAYAIVVSRRMEIQSVKNFVRCVTIIVDVPSWLLENVLNPSIQCQELDHDATSRVVFVLGWYWRRNALFVPADWCGCRIMGCHWLRALRCRRYDCAGSCWSVHALGTWRERHDDGRRVAAIRLHHASVCWLHLDVLPVHLSGV
uniref:Uncharacterized protein n=1 Tax=Hyaloperonospora arabidopsidis (strain Emoy2) TaxID=559515 RepID=M4BSP1_HYAAE